MSAIIRPAEVVREHVRREKRKRRIASFMREGLSPREAMRAVAAMEAVDMADQRKRERAEKVPGTELVTSAPPPRKVYSDTARDRLAARIKQFLASQSSEQAFRMAVQTAQQADRESGKE